MNLKLLDRYFDRVLRFINIDKSLVSFSVDFEKPWWWVFSHVKSGIAAAGFYNLIYQTYMELRISILGYIFVVQKFEYLWYMLIAQLTLDMTVWIINRRWIMMYELVMFNIKQATFVKLMTVDPIFHSTRSSGKVLGKIDRGIQAYFDFISLLTENVLPFLIKLVVSCGVLFVIDWQTGVIGIVMVVFLLMVNALTVTLNTSIFVPKINLADDTVKQNLIEGISQVGYIRSTFSTESIVTKFRMSQRSYHILNASRWRILNHIVWPLWILFLCGVFGILFHVLGKIVVDPTLTPLYIASLATYMSAGNDIWVVANDIERLIKSLRNINELYEFIRGFGQRTYPVLEDTSNL
jgi:ABC-type multidrug transport system fused ATPase/permease subunit